MREIFLLENLMETEACIVGLTAQNTKDHGKKELFTELAFFAPRVLELTTRCIKMVLLLVLEWPGMMISLKHFVL